MKVILDTVTLDFKPNLMAFNLTSVPWPSFAVTNREVVGVMLPSLLLLSTGGFVVSFANQRRRLTVGSDAIQNQGHTRMAELPAI